MESLWKDDDLEGMRRRGGHQVFGVWVPLITGGMLVRCALREATQVPNGADPLGLPWLRWVRRDTTFWSKQALKGPKL